MTPDTSGLIPEAEVKRLYKYGKPLPKTKVYEITLSIIISSHCSDSVNDWMQAGKGR